MKPKSLDVGNTLTLLIRRHGQRKARTNDEFIWSSGSPNLIGVPRKVTAAYSSYVLLDNKSILNYPKKTEYKEITNSGNSGTFTVTYIEYGDGVGYFTDLVTELTYKWEGPTKE